MLDEAKNINKSLSALGNVISALAEGTVSARCGPHPVFCLPLMPSRHHARFMSCSTPSKHCHPFFLFLNIKKNYFIYLAAPGLNGGMWDLLPQPGIEPRPPTLGAQNLHPWMTTREIPSFIYFFFGHAMQLAGSQFPNRRLNPGHGSESLES